MAVTGLEIRAREPFAGGERFGAVGAYERIDGVLRFGVDPAQAANGEIVDLERAARGADGRVHFAADFCLLQPLDAARGNRRLLFDVLNRGRKAAVRNFNRGTPELTPSVQIDPADGFLMRRGWTVAWTGWQWDVAPVPALMGLAAPQALGPDGRPIQGEVLIEVQTNELLADHLLADRGHQPYPAADADDPAATLTVRDRHEDTRTLIARSRWRFAREEDGRTVADETCVWLEGGFEPGRIYEVCYRTRGCPVVGTGLLAARDTGAFLRYADRAEGNPCAGRLDHAVAYGVSQSGRFLRSFLYHGLNLDEVGRPVYDAVWAHVAGARRGEFNHRYAQPSVQYTHGIGNLMPFADREQTDPRSGRSDGLLSRQRRLGGVPKVLLTNSGAEYWRGDASLIHSDMAGEDAEPGVEVRVYYFAGTQHGPGSLPQGRVSANDGTTGMHGFNTVDYTPLLRAALVNLERWVTEEVEPPPNAYPRHADGTAATRAEVLDAFRAFPTATVPGAEALRVIRRLDVGPDAARGIVRVPAEPGEVYPAYVSAVDEDGNETGGLRLPDLRVPLASNMGWNPRDPATGGAGLIINMQGSTLPFAATAEERWRSGDPRRAIEERYADRAAYLEQVRQAAAALVAERAVLAEDVELLVRLARERYDAFTRQMAVV